MSNVKKSIRSNVKCQKSIRLILTERTSGVPPVNFYLGNHHGTQVFHLCYVMKHFYKSGTRKERKQRKWPYSVPTCIREEQPKAGMVKCGYITEYIQNWEVRVAKSHTLGRNKIGRLVSEKLTCWYHNNVVLLDLCVKSEIFWNISHVAITVAKSVFASGNRFFEAEFS